VTADFFDALDAQEQAAWVQDPPADHLCRRYQWRVCHLVGYGSAAPIR
jgi:hypothetical protein